LYRIRILDRDKSIRSADGESTYGAAFTGNDQNSTEKVYLNTVARGPAGQGTGPETFSSLRRIDRGLG
jgi:hypothetical protein